MGLRMTRHGSSTRQTRADHTICAVLPRQHNYTGLLALDDETLLLSDDRLASGWTGPPGRVEDSDRVFAMRVKIAPVS